MVAAHFFPLPTYWGKRYSPPDAVQLPFSGRREFSPFKVTRSGCFIVATLKNYVEPSPSPSYSRLRYIPGIGNKVQRSKDGLTAKKGGRD